MRINLYKKFKFAFLQLLLIVEKMLLRQHLRVFGMYGMKFIRVPRYVDEWNHEMKVS